MNSTHYDVFICPISIHQFNGCLDNQQPSNYRTHEHQQSSIVAIGGEGEAERVGATPKPHPQSMCHLTVHGNTHTQGLFLFDLTQSLLITISFFPEAFVETNQQQMSEKPNKKERIMNLWETFKCTKIFITGVPETKEIKKQTERLYEKWYPKTFHLYKNSTNSKQDKLTVNLHIYYPI